MNHTIKSDTISIPKALWILVIVTSGILIIFHTYNDILITAKQGMVFWDALFSGKPLAFYEKAVIDTGNIYYPKVQPAAYQFPLYFVFAIWNLPIWIVEKAFDPSFSNTVFAMIWMKLMLIPFVIASSHFVYRIVVFIHKKKKYAPLAPFMFVSSILLLYSTMLIGQYDIIAVTLMTAGLYYWMQKNRTAFVILFIIAFFFKYFALLYYIPLLLLAEKRILHIIKHLVEVLVPAVFFIAIFPKPAEQVSNVSNMYRLFLSGIKIGETDYVYLFPLIFFLVSVAAYLINCEGQEQFEYAILLLLIVMGSFCVIIRPNPYWCILAVPVFVLAVFTTNNPSIILICETVLSIGITLKNYILYDWCISTRTVKAMGLLDHMIQGHSKPVNIDYSILSFLNGRFAIVSTILTLLIGTLIIMVYYVSPKVSQNSHLGSFNTNLIYTRCIMNCVVVLLPLAAIVWQLI